MGIDIPGPIDEAVGEVVDTAKDAGSAGLDFVTDAGSAGVDFVTDVGGAAVDTATDLAGNPLVRAAAGGAVLGPAGALFGAATAPSDAHGIMGPGPTGTGCVPRSPLGGFLERAFSKIGNIFGGQQTSDQMLDGAKSYQDGFADYLDLYNEYTGATLSMERDIIEPFDTLRGIDFGRLSTVAKSCADVATKFNETMGQLDSDVASNTAEWSGQASDAFLAHVFRYGDAAKAIDTDLSTVADATSDSAEAVQKVISEYTDALGDIDFSGFDAPDTVSLLIKMSKMEFSAGDLVAKLYDGIGDLIGLAMPAVVSGGGGGVLGSIPGVGDAVEWVSDRINDLISKFGEMLGTALDFFGFGENLSALVEFVAGKVREYLDASFKQPFEANYELFSSATQTATDGTREAFQPMISAANAVQAGAFDGLAAPPTDDVQPPAPPQPPPPSQEPPGGQPPGGQPPGGQPPGGQPPGGQPPGGQPPVGQQPPPLPEQPGPTDPDPTDQNQPDPDDLLNDGLNDGGDQPEVTERPPGLPDGSGWVSDPSRVPPGWTMDPHTGELTPPATTEPFPGQDNPSSQLPGSPGQIPPIGGRPPGLPDGAGWISDPSALPEGWTVDPATGELSPPGSPDAAGNPEVHSPEGEAALAGTEPDGPGDGPGHGGGGGTGGNLSGEHGEVVVEDGDTKISVSGLSGPGDGVDVTITDEDGGATEYDIRMDSSGEADWTRSETAGDGGGSAGGDSAGGAGAGGGGAGGGGAEAGVTRTADGGGASAGAATAPAAAGASAGATAGGASGGAGGAGMMPMGAGAGAGGGDDQRQGGAWRVSGESLFDVDESAVKPVLGEGER